MIFSATRGNVDGTDYSSVWAESQEVVNEPDTIGKPPMKINADKSLVDSLRGKLPCMVKAKLKMVSAGGAKGGLYVISAVPADAANPAKA